jgi:hypothetical protein
LICGEKFGATHDRSLHRLNGRPFVARQLRILEQGHQRFALLDRPPQFVAPPLIQIVGELSLLELPASASVNDEVGLMLMNHFSAADPATVKAVVAEEIKGFEGKGGLETAIGVAAQQNLSPKSQGILIIAFA